MAISVVGGTSDSGVVVMGSENMFLVEVGEMGYGRCDGAMVVITSTQIVGGVLTSGEEGGEGKQQNRLLREGRRIRISMIVIALDLARSVCTLIILTCLRSCPPRNGGEERE